MAVTVDESVTIARRAKEWDAKIMVNEKTFNNSLFLLFPDWEC